MAVLPSPDPATEKPCSTKVPTPAVPPSFGPCCANCASASCDEKSSMTEIRTDAPNIFAALTCAFIEAPCQRAISGYACLRGTSKWHVAHSGQSIHQDVFAELDAHN